MGPSEKNRLLVNGGIIVRLLIVFLILVSALYPTDLDAGSAKNRLFWFIPDGMRCDPQVFNVFRWANDGHLPNIAKMMKKGSYGYCKPVYPGHTPVNFATLFTGAYPENHGVSDGPMHESGRPLDRVAVGGFSSAAKKIDPIWVSLENNGYKVGLLSIPGSTPPELKKGFTLAGRWGGWGASFHAVNFEEYDTGNLNFKSGASKKLFFFGPPLMKYVSAANAKDAPAGLKSYSPVKTAVLESWKAPITAYIMDSTNDGKENYDSIFFYRENGTALCRLKPGRWSDWHSIRLVYSKGDLELPVNTEFKIRIILLEDNGYFRIRFYFNALNSTLSQPADMAEDLIDNIGPMVDFADNFPPQLIHYTEDKEVFLEEAAMSFEWHREAARYILDRYKPEVFIHDIYTPNQMLTSRWWLGFIDPASALYDSIGEEERSALQEEVLDMYTRLDNIIGEYIQKAGKDTYVILSSDHGAVPLHTWVNLNNFFADKGWLKYTIDGISGEPKVDWMNSSVIYLKFGQIYINPGGLHDADGIWRRAAGPEYIALRSEVISSLEKLSDGKGRFPLDAIACWEDAEKTFRLPHERCGDLIISNKAGFGWNETITTQGKIFTRSLKTGYKQALNPDISAMWTPFVIMGPGIKEGYYLGDTPVSMTDQYPTIMTLLGQKLNKNVQGTAIDDIFKARKQD
jgi:predicted AlkP superfamily phosphohydrolase/phosphomutase